MNAPPRAKVSVGPERMAPWIGIPDPGAAWRVGEAVLRLRRELAWRRARAELGGGLGASQDALDLLRHEEARAAFFAADAAAAHLCARIGAGRPDPGSRFERFCCALALDEAERQVLGLALAAALDAALAPVFAEASGDAARAYPTVALAQALFDAPIDALAAFEPARPLRALGVLSPCVAPSDPIALAPGLARYLAGAAGPETQGLALVRPDPDAEAPPATAMRLARPPEALEIVPVLGAARADVAGLLSALAAWGARPCLRGRARDVPLAAAIAAAEGADLALARPCGTRDDATRLAAALDSCADLPVRVLAHLTDRTLVAAFPGASLAPTIEMPRTTRARRAAILGRGLPGLDEKAVAETARDFRVEPAEAERVAGCFPDPAAPPDRVTLRAACRAECAVDLHGLAEELSPVFGRGDIVLPAAVAGRFDEAVETARGVAGVEALGGAPGGVGGLAFLFSGPSGTGKTMAARILARELDLPLLRVDVSRVVDKYIGETEKNLGRLFDSAERQRSVLFFDEADAIFGKRTEVRDANDRYANLETGYLLQRIEGYSGVAILATNRKRDLDDAFMRRLALAVEFPPPGREEREAIWRRSFPPRADVSALDVPFLARAFALTGGHIRTVALNAAMRAAARGEARMGMRDVLIAVKRELEKLDRTAGPDLFAQWSDEIEELRA